MTEALTFFRCFYDDCALHGVARQILETDGPIPAGDERRSCPGCGRPLDRYDASGVVEHVAAERPASLTDEELAEQAAAAAASALIVVRAGKVEQIDEALARSDVSVIRHLEDGNLLDELRQYRAALRLLRDQALADADPGGLELPVAPTGVSPPPPDALIDPLPGPSGP